MKKTEKVDIMHGCYGRILTVDLTGRTAAVEFLPDDLLAAYLGGKGLATHLLLERNPPGVDPLSPENRLIIATGPFCNSRIWGGSRYGVFTKSPLTGLYSESYSGGKVPEAIDAAGYDAVVFTGCAKRPVAVTVHPEGADFHEAGDLWGKDVYDTEAEALKRYAASTEGYGKPGAVVIGPAGERLVRYALIANDRWRCAGRTGVGAVMGSKKLKAVVFQGDRTRVFHQPDAVAEYCKAFSKKNMRGAGRQGLPGHGHHHDGGPDEHGGRLSGQILVPGHLRPLGEDQRRNLSQGTCGQTPRLRQMLHGLRPDGHPRPRAATRA